MKPKTWPTVWATLTIGITGFMAFAALTHDFTVLTSEAARRKAVAQSPVVVQNIEGRDQTGSVHGIFSEVNVELARPRVVIADFIYTRCENVCTQLGATYQQLQSAIQARHLQDEIHLVTVSFDPTADTRSILSQYAQRMRADPKIWTVIGPMRPAELPAVLKEFGVVIIPTRPDQFQHNAAFHIIDERGRLVQIVEANDPAGALDAAITLSRHRDLAI